MLLEQLDATFCQFLTILFLAIKSNKSANSKKKSAIQKTNDRNCNKFCYIVDTI